MSIVRIGWGIATAAAAAYLLREQPIEVRDGVRRFSSKATKAALDALISTSLDSADVPGQFAMHVVAPDDEAVPTMRMIAESHASGLSIYASDSILELSAGRAGLVDVVLIIADPTEGPLIAGPGSGFAELVSANSR